MRRFHGLRETTCQVYRTFTDKGPHHAPHIHAEYAGIEAVVSIPEGKVIEMDPAFPPKKLRMVQTWIDIHEEELMSDWNMAVKHGEVFKIRGLDQA